MADPLEPASVAAAIAPVIDRLRMAIVRRIPAATADVEGVLPTDPHALQVLSMLRNLLPSRSVPTDCVRAAFVYWPPSQVDAALEHLVSHTYVAIDADDVLALEERGREVLLALRGALTQVIDELWSASEAIVPELGTLAGRALGAVEPSPDGAFRLVSPPYEPEGTSPAVLLAERLTPLRFHRFDAHVAAWRAAGLTVPEVQDLPPGPQRDAIEAATNAAAAAPYAALSPAERFRLTTGLGALAG